MVALSLIPSFKKTSYVVVFDIGSASVGVAIARYEGDKNIDVLFTHRELISFGTKQSADALGSYVAKTLGVVGEKAIAALGTLKGIGGNYSVHAVVHAPWADTYSDRAESTLTKETIITREVLQQFVAHQISPTTIEGRVEFDRHITRIELNGYATTNPYKKKAEQIAITMLKSSMAEAVHAAIFNSFANLFPNHDIHIDAFLFATTQLEELFATNDSYTIIDVGGEYTSLSIVHEGIIAGSIWANFGTEYLVRAIARGDETNRQGAVSELAMYVNNTCTPAQCRKIEELLTDSERTWTKAFGDACTTLSKAHRIPTKAFVSVDKRYYPWFKTAIERLDFSQFTVTGKPFGTKIIPLEKAGKQLSFPESVKRDSMLSLAILFVDK
jgi:hypothetical protein